MNRALSAAGWAYVALCGVVLLTHLRADGGRVGGEPPAPAASFPGAAGEWFAQVKPFCNAVEVEVRQQQQPAPAGVDGAGYSAACYALAGKIDRARQAIEALSASDRSRAAGIVFEIGHPVADAGDDQSAGPIMRLVVSYQPDNYMALYHAGISEYGLGQMDYARTHLKQFLELYRQDDGWRGNALTVLRRLDGTAP
jgi:tetratricopeptide (TPR) repeat protein